MEGVTSYSEGEEPNRYVVHIEGYQHILTRETGLPISPFVRLERKQMAFAVIREFLSFKNSTLPGPSKGWVLAQRWSSIVPLAQAARKRNVHRFSLSLSAAPPLLEQDRTSQWMNQGHGPHFLGLSKGEGTTSPWLP